MLVVSGYVSPSFKPGRADNKTPVVYFNPLGLQRWNINHWERRIFFQFEIIINFLVSSFCFILIPMVWVYDHYKYCNCFSSGTVFRSQNLNRWRWRNGSFLKILSWEPLVPNHATRDIWKKLSLGSVLCTEYFLNDLYYCRLYSIGVWKYNTQKWNYT